MSRKKHVRKPEVRSINGTVKPFVTRSWLQRSQEVKKKVDELLAGKQFPYAVNLVEGLKVSRRQARKFLQHKGAAYAAMLNNIPKTEAA